MAKVHITNVVVLDNPSSFFNPFQFELTFECIEELKEDLEWKMIYVGSAESEEHDQTLDTIYVGPVPEGRHIFVFQADPPDVTRIPGKKSLNFLPKSFIDAFSITGHFRTRCCRRDNCSADMFISWTGIRPRRLFHKQWVFRSRIKRESAGKTIIR